MSIIFYYTKPSQPTFLVRFQFILCPILFHVGTISHRADIAFLIQICNELNKWIFCYKNQWVSCWRININRWRQREYRYWNISDKTVNWILAEGKVRERYIRKGNKNGTKSNGELYLPDISVCNTNLQRGLKQNEYKYKMKAPLFLFSLTFPSVGFSLLFLWFSIGDFSVPGLLKIRLI